MDHAPFDEVTPGALARLLLPTDTDTARDQTAAIAGALWDWAGAGADVANMAERLIAIANELQQWNAANGWVPRP